MRAVRGISDLAREFSCNASSIHAWVKAAGGLDGSGTTGIDAPLSMNERQELLELRRKFEQVVYELVKANQCQVPPVAKAPPVSASTMPLEDACKFLKAMPAARWESLEQTQRTLVQQSHPSRWKTLSTAKRIQALAEAKRVNAASAVLSQARCGGCLRDTHCSEPEI